MDRGDLGALARPRGVAGGDRPDAPDPRAHRTLVLAGGYLLAFQQLTNEAPFVHSRGISAVMLLVLDLLSRGYKVVLSTHAPLVLDVVWALQRLQRAGAPWQAVLRLFGIEGDQRVHSQDITSLDPGSPDRANRRGTCPASAVTSRTWWPSRPPRREAGSHGQDPADEVGEPIPGSEFFPDR